MARETKPSRPPPSALPRRPRRGPTPSGTGPSPRRLHTPCLPSKRTAGRRRATPQRRPRGTREGPCRSTDAPAGQKGSRAQVAHRRREHQRGDRRLVRNRRGRNRPAGAHLPPSPPKILAHGVSYCTPGEEHLFAVIFNLLGIVSDLFADVSDLLAIVSSRYKNIYI